MKSPIDIQKKISEKGVKVTPQRIAVFQALWALRHACTDDLVAEVHKHHPSISLATIYNTLDCFSENGLIARFNTPDNRRCFDINTVPHHHLYSETDKKIEDYEDVTLDRIIREHLEKNPVAGFDLNKVTIQLTGYFK